MDFRLSERQQAVADVAADVLRHDPDDARTVAALDSAAGFDEALWKSLAQTGLLELALPADAGGDGCGPVEVALVLTEVGRQTHPLPALATLGLGVLPITACATPDQQRELLGGLADGDVVTAALRDAPGTTCGIQDGLVSGIRTGVPYAAQARWLLVPTGDGTAVVDPSGSDVSAVRTPTSTGMPEYTVTFHSAPARHLLQAGPAEFDRWAVLAASATADGVVDAAMQLTARHLAERTQFGRPLATFQAVAQEIADVYVAARTLALTARSVAWRLAEDVEADEDLAVAAYWLTRELPRALQTCHHLHGGLGVDITYPMHRYYSMAKDLARFVGGASARLDRLGELCASN